MEQWGSNYVKLVNFNNLETLTYHLFGVTGIESSMEKSARWTNLLQETTQSAWWHIQNGQNTFLGRFFVLWESFQGGVMRFTWYFLKIYKTSSCHVFFNGIYIQNHSINQIWMHTMYKSAKTNTKSNTKVE